MSTSRTPGLVASGACCPHPALQTRLQASQRPLRARLKIPFCPLHLPRKGPSEKLNTRALKSPLLRGMPSHRGFHLHHHSPPAPCSPQQLCRRPVFPRGRGLTHTHTQQQKEQSWKTLPREGRALGAGYIACTPHPRHLHSSLCVHSWHSTGMAAPPRCRGRHMRVQVMTSQRPPSLEALRTLPVLP